jgi:hypothetical protein
MSDSDIQPASRIKPPIFKSIRSKLLKAFKRPDRKLIVWVRPECGRSRSGFLLCLCGSNHDSFSPSFSAPLGKDQGGCMGSQDTERTQYVKYETYPYRQLSFLMRIVTC